MDSGDAAVDNGCGARWGPAGETAWLQGDVDLGAAGGGTGLLQCNDFGMGLARGTGAAFADDFSVLYNDGTDRGVGGREAKGAMSQGEAMLHEAPVGEGGGRGTQPGLSPEERDLKFR